MCISFEPAANEKGISVCVSSAFLLEDALELDAAVSDAAPGTSVEVDFRQVREFQAPALARLADLLRAGHARLALRGISSHEVKLLGYLGAPVDTFGEHRSPAG